MWIWQSRQRQSMTRLQNNIHYQNPICRTVLNPTAFWKFRKISATKTTTKPKSVRAARLLVSFRSRTLLQKNSQIHNGGYATPIKDSFLFHCLLWGSISMLLWGVFYLICTLFPDRDTTHWGGVSVNSNIHSVMFEKGIDFILMND